ncbi:N-acetylmuramoyl-L-alanine amidase [Pyxidicoccus trucidator]|uniref:N-acetylmuramoyl-L-alanine amidase n=1 Tax=Pyxidicoccus trucidator TaxID=2709662 RepID=UPI0013DBFD6D|nr:N-acetylmuramoyl-L-alanine amidase [Pyxidicoccus trucidator]
MKNRPGIVVLAASLALTQACGMDAQQPQEASTAPTVQLDAPGTEDSAREDESFDALFKEAGAEFDVPPALLKSISFVQTRYQMVEGAEEFEGRPAVYGMMALTGTQLEEGAKLAGVTAAQARTDTRSHVRAAAALLSRHAEALKVDRTQAAKWAPAVAEVSGIQDEEGRRSFVHKEVFRVARLGLGKLSKEWTASGQGLAVEELGQQVQALAGPDYAPAVWRPSPNYNSRPMGVKMVVIHTCESSYSGCWSWLTNPNSGVSAHYVVREDGGEISQLVRDGSRGWHIGATYQCSNNSGAECGLNGRSANDFTIGIEHGGYASTVNWPVGQIDASARLLCDITRDHGIPRDSYHVVGHGKLQPYDRTDPGVNWPWRDYLNRANAHCGTACVLKGDIKAKYDAMNGPALLGKCQVGELATPDGVGRFNHFERGSIYWTPTLGAHVVMGSIRGRWEQLNWERGPLGYPIIDEWTAPDGRGRFNHFERGSIYWTPELGAWEVHGEIRNKWEQLGWERSVLGYPKTGEQETPDKTGRYNHFENGSIYWTAATGAHEVRGLIHAKWAELGWEKSALGYPLTDEQGAADGVGRYSHFQRGSIYFTPATGAHAVSGDINVKWVALSREAGLLGYPLTDETATPDGVGRFNHFQNGSIYWTAATGAHEVHGPIRAKWESMGWERSTLGYPVRDEYAVTGGRESEFQKGFLTLNTATNAVTVRMK